MIFADSAVYIFTVDYRVNAGIKKVMVVTGGGDAPGLNAVIRAIVKLAVRGYGWEVVGSADAYNGILSDPMDVCPLTMESVRGLLARGGTILGTTSKGPPFEFPIQGPDGQWTEVDRSDDLIERISDHRGGCCDQHWRRGLPGHLAEVV